MTEDEKMEVAIFRFAVISDFVNGSQMDREEKQRLLQDKCARKWNIPFSTRTSISKSTIRRWVRLYNKSNRNLKSLCPGVRTDPLSRKRYYIQRLPFLIGHKAWLSQLLTLVHLS